MKAEKILTYKGIGEVRYAKNPRARNLSIRINAKGEVRVTVPRACSMGFAEKFVLKKKNWIMKKQDSVVEKSRQKEDFMALGKIELFKGIMLTGTEDSEDNIALKGLEHAKKVLPSYLDNLSKSHMLPYTRLTVRRMKSRWGSCSSKNTINLNSALVFLPEELIRYVCLHELAHTKHKNHGQEFWVFLEELEPRALELRKKLHDQPIIA